MLLNNDQLVDDWLWYDRQFFSSSNLSSCPGKDQSISNQLLKNDFNTLIFS